MIKGFNKNEITIYDLRENIKKYGSDIHIIENIGICGDGEIYIYKGSKNVKFPLYTIGKKVVFKYVGQCCSPDNEFRKICGDIKIYTVDVNIKNSDIVYEVISKKEYISSGNNIEIKDIWIDKKHIYLKRINLFGIDNPNYDTILNYFNY